MEKYDFSGWATRNDLTCADGRVIKKDAFKNQDGEVVPLVWNHNHSGVDNVLGHALLENRDEGVYAYCTFNNSESGITAKELVKHGDVRSLSIMANQLKQAGNAVFHGIIRELSLVIAGANPGAFVDTVMAHGEDTETGMIIGYDENIMLYHSDEGEGKDEGKDEETVEDIFNTLNEKQKTVVYAMIGQALEESGSSEDDDSEGGSEDMKHNIFENDTNNESNVLSHSMQMDILEMAKSSSIGRFQEALRIYANDNGLKHDALSSGFVQTGDGNVTNLFPEYQEVRPGAPELITTSFSMVGWRLPLSLPVPPSVTP